MSAQTAALRGAAKQADDGIGDWLMGMVSGQGSSPSQVIISGILSVVPGLGQAMDLRDIVFGVIVISKSPASPMAWLDISITLIGCIPVMGDALKTSFRLLKSGQSLPRILDAASPALRGNLDQWFRQINWGSIASSVKSSFDDVIKAFINGLDSWLVKTVAGRKEVDFLIAQLKDMRRRAPKMLDEAIAELQALWKKALGDGVPKSTANVGGPRPGAALPAPASTRTASQSGVAQPQRKADATKRDKSHTAENTPDKAATDERRASRSKGRQNMAVLAEHLTDYWCARTRRNLKKANNGGRLWEEWDREGRRGIDHVWVQAGNPARPGVVADTKSSLFGAFKFLAALPPDIRAQLNALGDAEAANPIPNTDPAKPNIFHSEGRDSVSPGRVRVDGSGENVEELKKGLGKPNPETGLKTQMSHAWIVGTLARESLTISGRELLNKANRWFWVDRMRNPLAPPPYSRWIVMVTGRQKHRHEKSQGHRHEIQQPIIILPDGVLAE
ncbi:hypothetical protein [Pseudorhodoferax sp.]|uniref:hypothetical protein n=1 Tax=Pseudorhodoferax sp. TaxID=1993553 RepID=UPI0039E2AF58